MMAKAEDKSQSLEQFLLKFDRDNNSVTARDMRHYIPVLVCIIYGTVKWSDRPDDWPKDVPFIDPNNGGKKVVGEKKQKPKNPELLKMVKFLNDKYKKSRAELTNRHKIPFSAARGLPKLVQDQCLRLKQQISQVRNHMCANNQSANEQFDKLLDELDKRYKETQNQPQILCRAFNAVGHDVEKFLDQVILEYTLEDLSYTASPTFTEKCQDMTKNIKTTMDNTLRNYMITATASTSSTTTAASTSSTTTAVNTSQRCSDAGTDYAPPTAADSPHSKPEMLNVVKTRLPLNKKQEVAQMVKECLTRSHDTADLSPACEPMPKKSRVEQNAPSRTEFYNIFSSRNSPEYLAANRNVHETATMNCTHSSFSANRCAHSSAPSQPNTTIPSQCNTSIPSRPNTSTNITPQYNASVHSQLRTSTNITPQSNPSIHSQLSTSTNITLQSNTSIPSQANTKLTPQSNTRMTSQSTNTNITPQSNKSMPSPLRTTTNMSQFSVNTNKPSELTTDINGLSELTADMNILPEPTTSTSTNTTPELTPNKSIPSQRCTNKSAHEVTNTCAVRESDIPDALTLLPKFKEFDLNLDEKFDNTENGTHINSRTTLVHHDHSNDTHGNLLNIEPNPEDILNSIAEDESRSNPTISVQHDHSFHPHDNLESVESILEGNFDNIAEDGSHVNSVQDDHSFHPHDNFESVVSIPEDNFDNIADRPHVNSVQGGHSSDPQDNLESIESNPEEFFDNVAEDGSHVDSVQDSFDLHDNLDSAEPIPENIFEIIAEEWHSATTSSVQHDHSYEQLTKSKR